MPARGLRRSPVRHGTGPRGDRARCTPGSRQRQKPLQSGQPQRGRKRGASLGRHSRRIYVTFVTLCALDMIRIDINSDMGESFGAYTIGHDAGLMKAITSANVAAGFHGGDPSVLRATIRMAKANGVAVGAHPGFPDLVGFGRRELNVTPKEAEDFVLYQVAAVAG